MRWNNGCLGRLIDITEHKHFFLLFDKNIIDMKEHKYVIDANVDITENKYDRYQKWNCIYSFKCKYTEEKARIFDREKEDQKFPKKTNTMSRQQIKIFHMNGIVLCVVIRSFCIWNSNLMCA